ncbi:hypothetical protein [Stenotrophomonas sp.]|uniref:hypothetical protein n=1 Tax=Stenotrophomonas sp. TaxID=69392 RepID=UPI002FC587D1
MHVDARTGRRQPTRDSPIETAHHPAAPAHAHGKTADGNARATGSTAHGIGRSVLAGGAVVQGMGNEQIEYDDQLHAIASALDRQGEGDHAMA